MLRIHPIQSPYTEEDKKFYVSTPEEIPSERTVECPHTGKDIQVEYVEAEDNETAFGVVVSKVDEDD
jgi:hypothetical protein